MRRLSRVLRKTSLKLRKFTVALVAKLRLLKNSL
ncbi:unnamed protein product [Schistosoma margrebowiei]|uniref:Uncharacterized protein n=1 Tax=Schistosoma margrebowiei TaxID=48269 RepID=A0A183M9Q9_9TREM|nr:unnamed protein product [Schistosoma margrebowiei]